MGAVRVFTGLVDGELTISNEANLGAEVVVGIDVGGARKGFHAVALRDGELLGRFASADPKTVAAWCRRIGARAVGVDAPCRWSADGRARPAERSLMRAGIHCFASPTREAALAHPKNWYGWMLAGEALYAALRRSYRLAADPVAHALASSPSSPSSPVVFETFPQAIACVLAGRPVPARDKVRAWRTVLRSAGIDPASFGNIDWVDAALCAVAAEHFVAGRVRWHGESPNGRGTGHIILPLPLPESRVDAALIRAYRAARYGVSAAPGEGGPFALQVDVPSARLLALLARHSVREAAYLTACNPRSERLTDAENRRRMVKLETALRASGRVVIAGRGEDVDTKGKGRWPGEPSMLALGMSEAEAMRLGDAFAQNAVLHAGRDGVPRLVLLR